MKKALSLLPFLVSSAYAANVTVEITNLTRGIYFTPFVVAVHDQNTRLFSVGSTASGSLQAMAEGGDISGLASDLNTAGAAVVQNPASGLLAPGASTTATFTNTSNTQTHLSLAAMLLPTNDGFGALNGLQIPTTPGTYTFNANAYDSGTEANNEIRGGGAVGVAGFPVPPSSPVDASAGTGGTGINASVEGFVHIHRGVLGDDSQNSGDSDIDNKVHRWLNPVLRITVTVQ